jgi:hypothetical protein
VLATTTIHIQPSHRPSITNGPVIDSQDRDMAAEYQAKTHNGGTNLRWRCRNELREPDGREEEDGQGVKWTQVSAAIVYGAEEQLHSYC